MKLPSIISIAVLLLMAKPTFAQQPQVVLSLPTEAPVFVPGIISFDLADLTGDSLVLGYLQMSTQNIERQAVKSPMPKEAWLKKVTTANTLASFTQLVKPVLYVVNDISVGRLANGKAL